MSAHAVATRLAHPFPHVRKRVVYWGYFQVMLVTLYAGMLLDITTTRFGFQQMGSRWEQDPASAALLNHLGFIGLAGLMTALCLVFYLSCRMLFRRASLKLAMFFNLILTFAVLERWLTVGLTLAYLRTLQS